MREFVKSLKRLYEKGSGAVTKEKLREFVENAKITPYEYEWITGEKYEDLAET